MTREEAIEILKQFKKCLADVVFDEKGSEAWQMAIQALSQEPCDDVISREAVNNLQRYRYNCGDTTITCISLKSINELPSVTQKSGKWISVSERLPEDGTYLVTVERMCGTPSVNIRSFAKNLYSVDEFDFHNKKGKSGWYDYDSEYGYWEDEKVTAWMPLPELYKAESEE